MFKYTQGTVIIIANSIELSLKGERTCGDIMLVVSAGNMEIIGLHRC